LRLAGWRIVQSRHAKMAFDGEGARRFGGRWNHKGTPVVYTASSMSLAALEMLVHLSAPEILIRYVSIPIEFDDSLCIRLDPKSLPRNWRNSPPLIATRDVGTEWVNNGASAILAVPSAMVPAEWNFLINPKHPDFRKVSIGGQQPFKYDPRLLKT
jgi:RES domain-containing protein